MAKYKAYPKYKESGVKWLDKLPLKWSTEKTKRMFSLKRNLVGHLSNSFQLLSLTLNGVIPRDISSGEGKIPASFDTYQSVQAGDLIFCLFDIDETPRTIGLAEQDGMITGAYNVYSCMDKCLPGYAYYYFLHIDSFKGLKPFYTGLRKVVRAETFGCIEMPNPSLSEQEKICLFLDHETAKIDNLIEKQQQLIVLLKEKRQAVISHTVTKGLNFDVPMKDSGVEWLGEVPEHWTVCRLKQIIKSGTSISYGIVQPGDSLDEGIPFIQTTNISQGNLQLESLPKTSGEIEKNYPRSRLDGGEVILGIRASIGSAYVVPLELKGANLSRGVARIQPGSSITSEYLVWYLKTNAVEQYWALSKQGSTFSEVSIETVRELTVCVPPKDEQYNIASRLEGALDRIHKLIVKSEIKMSLLRERRAALISAAVTGKIDVRDWVATDTQDVEEPQEATA
ncbi:TPA: restriction endonuclease subunit S [Enterobacter cloacae]|nr:restriction endonuclease subunit S [Enterobacter pasteurii]